MKANSLYKAFAGRFFMLDENGEKTNYFKDYGMFRNTYGIVFFINAATRGRCYAIYFARNSAGWNYRTVFPVGRIIEEGSTISIKTRYNSFVWDASENIASDRIESLYQWIRANGEIYIPGLNRHPGVKDYLNRGHHFE